MPTQVELKFAEFIDEFLKLDGFDGKDEQAGLQDAFVKIDDAFDKLSSAANTDSFLKLESEYVRTFDVIGGAFVKIDFDFHKIADFGEVVGNAISLLGGGSGLTNASATGGGGAGAQADFLKLDDQMKIAGTDVGAFGEAFLKIGDDKTSADFLNTESALGGDALKIDAAFQSEGADFNQLGADVSEIKYDALGADYIKLGEALDAIGSQFSALSTDFANLSAALTGPNGAGPSADVDLLKVEGGSSGPLGDAFLKIDHDFLKLDGALSNLGLPVAEIILGELKQFGA